jgi:predicted outer membrane repeat protein
MTSCIATQNSASSSGGGFYVDGSDAVSAPLFFENIIQIMLCMLIMHCNLIPARYNHWKPSSWRNRNLYSWKKYSNAKYNPHK